MIIVLHVILIIMGKVVQIYVDLVMINLAIILARRLEASFAYQDGKEIIAQNVSDKFYI